MGIPLGIKITIRDPEDSTKLIHAQFATARTHPELKDLLKRCAELDVKESVAVRRMQLATAGWEVETEEESPPPRPPCKSGWRAERRHRRWWPRAFVEAGFAAAGSTPEHASWLADRIAMEDLASSGQAPVRRRLH